MNGGQTQPRLYKSRANAMLEDAVVDEVSYAPAIISIGKITYNFTVNVRFELK